MCTLLTKLGDHLASENHPLRCCFLSFCALWLIFLHNTMNSFHIDVGPCCCALHRFGPVFLRWMSSASWGPSHVENSPTHSTSFSVSHTQWKLSLSPTAAILWIIVDFALLSRWGVGGNYGTVSYPSIVLLRLSLRNKTKTLAAFWSSLDIKHIARFITII